MQEEMGLEIRPGVVIPESELSFTATRSSGPGGQHVNTTASRVTLWFELEGSTALDEAQKARVRLRLAKRLGADGRLQVSVQSSRSQYANRQAARELLAALLRAALATPKRRRPTAPTKASKERRIEAKKRRAGIKKTRVRSAGED
jgi:ribosome-associated protein